MGNPPEDRTVFLIRFLFSAAFFGTAFALIGLRLVDSLGTTNVIFWIVVTSATGFLAAWNGDVFWKRLIDFLRWW